MNDASTAPPPPDGGTTTIDPTWERSNEYILAPSQPNPDLQYYTANTYPLFNEDDSTAGASFTFTSTATWNGPNYTDMPLDGPGPIPGFVANDTWFHTYDRVGDGVTGTTYWFRANVDLGPKANLVSVTLSDKYYPGRLAINDGIIVFMNGAPGPVMPNAGYEDCYEGSCSSPPGPEYGSGLTNDDTATGWSLDALPLSLDAVHDGTNEIAIEYDERYGDGGLAHLVLVVVTTP